MGPARERLDADDRAVVERHDRLVGDLQLVVVQRPAQVVLEPQPFGDGGAHRVVEDRRAPRPSRLAA